MALKRRWLAWFLPLLFLGLIFWSAWYRDPDFWRSGASLHRAAREIIVLNIDDDQALCHWDLLHFSDRNDANGPG